MEDQQADSHSGDKECHSGRTLMEDKVGKCQEDQWEPQSEDFQATTCLLDLEETSHLAKCPSKATWLVEICSGQLEEEVPLDKCRKGTSEDSSVDKNKEISNNSHKECLSHHMDIKAHNRDIMALEAKASLNIILVLEDKAKVISSKEEMLSTWKMLMEASPSQIPLTTWRTKECRKASHSHHKWEADKNSILS